MHREADGIMRTLAYVGGFGVGILWIAMAAGALVSAARGFAYQRTDWGIGWGLVGVLLLGAGSISIIGTWWHQHRVKSHR
ncbi:MAG TPA: hypothetical protein VF188_15005 [Longimicrobiales bacterium]